MIFRVCQIQRSLNLIFQIKASDCILTYESQARQSVQAAKKTLVRRQQQNNSRQARANVVNQKRGLAQQQQTGKKQVRVIFKAILAAKTNVERNKIIQLKKQVRVILSNLGSKYNFKFK